MKISIVATPIGNLEDITFRAIKSIKESDLILAEDTRVTKKLLKLLSIEYKEIIMYNQHTDNEAQKIVDKIIEKQLKVCLISDAGTPLIADPGSELIKLAIQENITIESLPGACSPIVALTISGFDCSKFTFNGFLPKTKTKLNNSLTSALMRDETQIFFVTKHNVNEVLREIKDINPMREIFLGRELTKLNEEHLWINLSEFDIENLTLKGEYVLIINKHSQNENLTDEEVHLKMQELIQKMKPKEAAKILSEVSNLTSKEIYSVYINSKE